MQYIYHRKPHNMVGNILYPLNEMKKTLPEVYISEAAKYKGRESLMEEIVPILNCKWNDVLHFSPIEPSIVYQELVNAGLSPDKDEAFFKVPLEYLDEELTVIYKYENEVGELIPDQFIKLMKNSFRNLSELPAGTKAWYKYCFENKRRPLLFHLVPHILTKSSIDISKCETVFWV